MEENKKVEWLLECLIHVIGRAAIRMDEVRDIVGDRAKQIRAYNLCNGSLTQNQIAKKIGLDQGNFSRSVDRWFKSGVMFRFEEGNEIKLLHVFPIPDNLNKRTKSKKGVK
jgi:hypothetical protein